jgi:hypothetical protein
MMAGLLFLPSRPAAGEAPPADYTGAGSCSSSHCHGSLRPRAENRVTQDEHTIWVTKDEHAQAYSHLLSERSKTIARNLKMQAPPEKDARCLDCHALNAPAERRGRTFDLADGVSCEACHGPAEQWLGPHTTRGWTHAQSVQAGMRDTKDPIVRAETCAACHIGDAGKTVTHEMYAAGHPELVFEMQWASASMPRHWKEVPDRGAFFTSRLWAVGQAVHLREQMARAGRSALRSRPEYAEFDCGSCHHELMQKSWRQARGYEGRRPGDPPIDLTRWRVLAPLARRVAPDLAQVFDAAARDLIAAAGGGESLQEPAARASSAADSLGRKLDDPGLDLGREATLSLLAALAGDAAPAREFGYRGAGQIAMSLDALTRPLIASEGDAGRQLDAAVGRLFAVLKDPVAYDPAAFASGLEAVAARLRDAGGPR